MSSAEKHKNTFIQRLQEGKNLSEIADELRISPRTAQHYLEQYKEDGTVTGDARTVEGLVVAGVEVITKKDKQCAFAGCDEPAHRNPSTGHLASRFCTFHHSAFNRRRNALVRQFGEGFTYSFDDFERDAQDNPDLVADALTKSTLPCLYPHCTAIAEGRDRNNARGKLCQEHYRQYKVWWNAEQIIGAITSELEGDGSPYYSVNIFIEDATAPDANEQGQELTVAARNALEDISTADSVRLKDLEISRGVLNTLLGKGFIREVTHDWYAITAQGRLALGLETIDVKEAQPMKPRLEVAKSKPSALENREPRREIVEVIAVPPSKRELPSQNGHLREEAEVIPPVSEAIAQHPDGITPSDPFVRDIPDLDPGFDITVYSRMQGIEVHVRVAPFVVRDMDVEEVVEYFTSIGTQVGLMLRFHNNG